MKKAKLFAFILLTVCAISYTSAQGFKDRFFHSIGNSPFLDIAITPLHDYEATVTDGSDKAEYKGSISNMSWSFLDFYTPRFNLYEADKDKSYSIDIPINIGLTTEYPTGVATMVSTTATPGTYSSLETSFAPAPKGFLRIGFPVYICANFGLGATYDSDASKGFKIGLGIDNMLCPAFSFSETNVTETYSRFYVMPSLCLGYRYWKGDKAKEFNLKVSYTGSETVSYPVYGSTTGETRSASTLGLAFCLSWHRILNY